LRNHKIGGIEVQESTPQHASYDHRDIPPTLTSPVAAAFWSAVLLTGLGGALFALEVLRGVLALRLIRKTRSPASASSRFLRNAYYPQDSSYICMIAHSRNPQYR